ncbi:PD-(D/E)XK nuclease family protein [Flagellimonas pacifica]|uniref:PD-(D/E)XK nuclease superfamily protein n=1 Tax=Flagellimonas pacifica TaxID=1247520 RepID=A0A285MCH3_9FLAO|nr:PD-(D/E)XK nuclease family protein [Allomuricauda parva]SNY94850.1 PD-(D/E)XK nuclease superfamily protein [Allomuricauda parva]
MQQSFLEYVLDDLQKKNVPIGSCIYVLPSKRSGTFLKKHISNQFNKNIFSPEIISIEDFVAQIAGITTAPTIDLLLELYGVYLNSAVEVHDDFLTFLKWGQTLLQDFNEIDRYLIPAKDILNYLSAIKELNHWSLKKDKTNLVENYLLFWNHLESLYSKFSENLLAKQKGYQGLVYRTAVDKLEGYKQNTTNKPIIFIGFNALNTAESNIIQSFLEQSDNHIYWDIDSCFLNDPVHDAGLFIRNYKQEWSYYRTRNILGVHNSYSSKKSISVTGVPKSISQAKYVGKILQDIHSSSNNGIQNTALVLADESLLDPILQVIPSAIHEVNITMGLPLNKTVLYSFFLSFLELSISRTKKGWFYKDALKFITNPYSITVSSSEKNNPANVIAKDIKERNWIYLTPSNLSNYSSSSYLDAIFPNKSPSPLQWIENSLSLVQMLKDIFQQENNVMELEYLYRFYTLFNQLKQHVSTLDFITDLKSIKSFFKQLASTEALDFIGEPLSGLQIMGMLESRNLDFETVILTSVNEGILPSGKSNNSFIPFDIKREYGLPTYKEKDAIYTYHFYRLIQRAKNVYLVYNTETDVLEGGEKSRLISQLLTDESISDCITHTIASPEVKINPLPTETIVKTPLLLQNIKKVAGSGFSPTSLSNYIRNPIEFYKKNILKIRDLDEVEENIAANTFGTIVHDSLEQLYQPLIGQILNLEHLTSLDSEIPKVVKIHFEKNLSGIDITKGKFLLVYSVIVKYLHNFINKEKEQLSKHEIKILKLEEKYEIALNVPGLDFPIKLKGTLDRVDEVDGVIRIVDYKTGRVEPRNVKITEWEELISNYDKSKAFQLLCYSYMYSKKHGLHNHLQAGIYSFKNLNQGFLSFSFNGNTITTETLKTFETSLHQLIHEICNPDIPFVEKEI